MSVQMPQRPEGMQSNGISEASSVRPASGPTHSLLLSTRTSGTAAQVLLSHTARLTDSFNTRNSSPGVAASLLHTHAVLDASHTALQRESRIFDRQA
ncbi:MAG TPA: hypothetical protein VNL35_22825 [Chloroflexota bacterium]|nr:hypothetical protein [Chloroflexota bacterium]